MKIEDNTYYKKRITRFICVFAGLFLILFLTALINIYSGNVNIPFSEIPSIIFNGDRDSKEYMILMTIRVPRILMAALLGGALALSGFLLQTFFENPIAGPFVLGISSGAKLIVAVYLIISIKLFSYASAFGFVLASFIGSLITTFFILLCSRRVKDNATLLVAGIMIGYIASSLTDFILNFAGDDSILNLHGWSMGSFSGTSWSDVGLAFTIVAAAFILTFILSKPIGAFRFGENYAASLGVNVKLFRILIILLSSLLSATVTAFAGPISFVGIAVPFLIKKALNSTDTVILIPAVFLSGAVFVMISDIIARCAFSPVELNISTVTGLLGAPVVVFMLLSRRRD